ncbi:kinase-like domain-containing protein [Xylaria castorea]|nr:kinase-like domain-containing protein [Xylaria castorea]
MTDRRAGEIPLVPWHKENELSRADINPVNITPPYSVCQTSVVGDGGDAKQLAQSSTGYSKFSEDKYSELQKRNDLHYIGGGFPSQNSRRRLSDDDRAEIGNDLFTEQSLELQLRTAMVNSVERNSGQKSFIPVDDLDSIINAKTILLELERLKIVPSRSLEDRTNQICAIHEGKSPQDGKNTITTRRRIFATLVLINQTPAILEVIKGGLYDWDLPLALDRSHPGFPQLVRKGTGDKPNPVVFSQNWPAYQHEAFFRCQWQLLSPYIEMRTQLGAKINHYPLDPNIILPITTINGPDRRGGFGNVSKIKIHPAHRNSLSSGSESWLALKRLQHSSEQAFRAEVGPLKRLGQDHPHLIQLLATYQYGGDYYLLFQWADGGNLDDFFQSYPHADFPPRDPKLSKWLAFQLLGLSSALASIHKCEPDSYAANMSSFNSDDTRKKYGTHGDLKPENILWFGKNDTRGENYSLGTLKIADFGLTSFHGLESRKKLKPAGISATYRAPEYDLNGHVSQRYDMWSLGCVLTELVTWYLLGGDAVTNFRTERLEDTLPGWKEDIFFSVADHPDFNHIGRATEKMSVRNHFSMLRNLPGCTDFLLDFIDFVEGHLLRMLPNKRCQVSGLLQFANSISQKCHEENGYCLERIKPLRSRQGTNLSELLSGPISHPTTRWISSPNSSVEILPPKPDGRASHQNITPSDARDSRDRISIGGPMKLSRELRQRERARSVSPVKEVETPITSQHQEDANGQHGGNSPSMSKVGNAKENEDHCNSRDLLNVLTSTSQQGPKAQGSNTIVQTDTIPSRNSTVSLVEASRSSYGDKGRSSFHERSGRTVPDVADEVAEREEYSVNEGCFAFSRIWTKIRTWSSFSRE